MVNGNVNDVNIDEICLGEEIPEYEECVDDCMEVDEEEIINAAIEPPSLQEIITEGSFITIRTPPNSRVLGKERASENKMDTLGHSIPAGRDYVTVTLLDCDDIGEKYVKFRRGRKNKPVFVDTDSVFVIDVKISANLKMDMDIYHSICGHLF